ncbi:heptaprenyl diphosphate synthase component 1 [Paenisporosarcina cavernae]|nr:heptaprenyl diphosphate synthase component 1 [Paenisporosarcina cavernae]
MSDQFIIDSIKTFKERCLRLVHHKTLLTYTGQPKLDDVRLFFLLLPFFVNGKWKEGQEEAAQAVALIQSALTAHDDIYEQEEISKDQQLTVLAGDFYSGMYYQLLAKTGDIELIQLLSTGIVSISEKKADFYDRKMLSFDHWMRNLTIIETLSFRQYYEYYGEENLISLMENGLILHVGQKTLNHWNESSLSNWSEIFLHKVHTPASSISSKDLFFQALDKVEKDVQDLISNLNSAPVGAMNFVRNNLLHHYSADIR